jgi:hypothetical protein
MLFFRLTWFDGELVETRAARSAADLCEELLEEWISDPEVCPLGVFAYLAAFRVSWGDRIGKDTTLEATVRRAAAESVMPRIRASDNELRMFLIACGEAVGVEEI